MLKKIWTWIKGQHVGPATVVHVISTVGALVGGLIVALTDPTVLSINTYLTEVVPVLSGSTALLALGRGVHLGGLAKNTLNYATPIVGELKSLETEYVGNDKLASVLSDVGDVLGHVKSLLESQAPPATTLTEDPPAAAATPAS